MNFSSIIFIRNLSYNYFLSCIYKILAFCFIIVWYLQPPSISDIFNGFMWDAVFGLRISLSVSQIRLNFSCVLIRSMCFPMILWLIEFLPYLWVVTVPVYGSFCGIDLILRISILLYIYIIAGEIVPKSMVRKAQSCNFTCSHVLMLTNENLINLYLVIMQTNLKDLINSCRCNRCSFINCKC